LLARNTLWNLLGQAAPLLVAVGAIPVLLRGLGSERFGILALAWVVIGYFSLFDLGLGRALTQMVARELGIGEADRIPALAWTALAMMLVLGVGGALVFAALTPWLIFHILKVPAELKGEGLATFYLLAASLPVVIVTTGLRGLLEAHQRFRLSNAVRVPMGIFTFGGPVIVLPFSRSLAWVVAVLLAGRLIAALAYAILCRRVVPALGKRPLMDRRALAPLLRFGGWMTVSNIVGPLMTYLDRFVIGAVISVTAVAYYATPYEVVSKLVVIPIALAGVLFPAFSASYQRDRGRAALLFQRGAKYLFLVLFPAALVVIALAQEGLRLWLGAEFAGQSTHVMQWLAAGFFLNSLAQVPFALVQGTGRAAWTAILHLVELPFYLLALAVGLAVLGIDGAAIAWALRSGIDMVVLFAMSRRLLLIPWPTVVRGAAFSGASLVALVVATVSAPFVLKVLVLAGFTVAFVWYAWFQLLSPEERAFGRDRVLLARAAN